MPLGAERNTWDAISEFEKYSCWNNLIPEALGELRQGATLNALISVPDAKPIRYTLFVDEICFQRKLKWHGHLFFNGICTGHHTFALEELGNGSTRVLNYEVFTGVLVPVFWIFYLNTKMRRGFNELNQNLKNYLETK